MFVSFFIFRFRFKNRMSYFILPPFSSNTPNKIGIGIEVSGKNTLKKTEAATKWRFAIADEPIDARIEGKKIFCVRVENRLVGGRSAIMIGFTPLATFDSNKEAYVGSKDFTGCGIFLSNGGLYYPVDKQHNIIDDKISEKAKEIVVILTVSNNGTKKEIRFLCDGHESNSADVSGYLEGDRLFPTIVLGDENQQVTIIPVDQIKTRTSEVERLILEYHYVPQRVELEGIFLHQHQILLRGMKQRMNLEMFKLQL